MKTIHSKARSSPGACPQNKTKKNLSNIEESSWNVHKVS